MRTGSDRAPQERYDEEVEKGRLLLGDNSDQAMVDDLAALFEVKLCHAATFTHFALQEWKLEQDSGQQPESSEATAPVARQACATSSLRCELSFVAVAGPRQSGAER